MTTLYIRDVADDVAETLKARAAADGMSLSAYVGSELARIAGRPTNAEIVARLKTRNRKGAPSTADILDVIHEGRHSR